MRPVLDRFKTLYFYNTLYEGGVCDRNIFIVGTTPAQTLEKMIPYVMNKWGKKIYTVAADYIYGQTTAKWVKKYVVENGGEVLVDRLLPARRDKLRSDHREDSGGQTGHRHVGVGRRRSHFVLSAMGRLGHEEADSDGLDDFRPRQRAGGAHAGGRRRHYLLRTATSRRSRRRKISASSNGTKTASARTRRAISKCRR